MCLYASLLLTHFLLHFTSSDKSKGVVESQSAHDNLVRIVFVVVVVLSQRLSATSICRIPGFYSRSDRNIALSSSFLCLSLCSLQHRPSFQHVCRAEKKTPRSRPVASAGRRRGRGSGREGWGLRCCHDTGRPSVTPLYRGPCWPVITLKTPALSLPELSTSHAALKPSSTLMELRTAPDPLGGQENTQPSCGQTRGSGPLSPEFEKRAPPSSRLILLLPVSVNMTRARAGHVLRFV